MHAYMHAYIHTHAYTHAHMHKLARLKDPCLGRHASADGDDSLGIRAIVDVSTGLMSACPPGRIRVAVGADARIVTRVLLGRGRSRRPPRTRALAPAPDGAVAHRRVNRCAARRRGVFRC